MNFNEQKATAVAAYFLEKAGGTLSDLKLMKLMYLAEREMIRRVNVSITGDKFCSMQNGPVLSETLNLMRSIPTSGRGEYWAEHVVSEARWHLKLVKPVSERVLSRMEQAVVQQQWEVHGQKHKWDLVDLTHTFPEWDEGAKTRKTSIPISMLDLLKALDLPESSIESRLAAQRAADHFEALLEQTSRSEPEHGR